MRRAVCVVLALCLASASWAGVSASGEVATTMVQEIQSCREFRAVAVERYELYEQAAAAMEEQRGLDGERIKGLEADKGALRASLADLAFSVDELASSREKFKNSLVVSAEALERCERSKPSRTTWAAIGAAAGLLLGIVAGR